MNQTDVNYLPQTQQFQCRNNVTQLNEKEKMINETDKTFQSEHHDSQTHLIKDNNVYKSKGNYLFLLYILNNLLYFIII
jgi:hypothetical protein